METLEQHIGKEFVKERHGIRIRARLDEVRRGKVKLTGLPLQEDYEETYTMPIAKFQKFFTLVEEGTPSGS